MAFSYEVCATKASRGQKTSRSPRGLSFCGAHSWTKEGHFSIPPHLHGIICLSRLFQTEKLGEMVAQFGISEGDAILDVGTGTGVLLPLLGKATGPGAPSWPSIFRFPCFSPLPATTLRFARPSSTQAWPPFLSNRGPSIRSPASPPFPISPTRKAPSEMVRVLKKGGALFIAHLHSIEEITRLHHEVGGSVMRTVYPIPRLSPG